MHQRAVIRFRILIHSLFWLGYFTMALVVGAKLVAPVDAFVRAVIGLGILAISVYFIFLVLLPRLFQTKRYLFFFSSFLAVMGSTIGLRTWVDHHLLWQHGGTTGMPLLDNYSLIITITSTVIVMMVAWGYWFGEQAYLGRMQQLLVEKEKVQVERDFLRSQINPHFLFNTLNNLYSLALAKSDQMPEVVLKLSDLMRYMLYDSAAPWVLLKSELHHLQNYIELQQLKTRQPQNIALEVVGDPSEHQIVPMLLVPLLENSLKHSDVQDGGWVHLHFQIVNRQLKFRIENSLRDSNNSSKEEVGGIGLDNVRKRLEMLYPQQHLFTLSENEKRFLVQLEIPLV